MKPLALFVLAAVGMILLTAGIFLGLENATTRNICFIAGAALLFLFYILTIIRATQIQKVKPSMRHLWLIIIISVPVVGALIFLAVDKDPNTAMVPEKKSWGEGTVEI